MTTSARSSDKPLREWAKANVQEALDALRRGDDGSAREHLIDAIHNLDRAWERKNAS